MSKRKLFLAYVCLVGAPLLGLLGIIRAGQHLVPPISVGGTWNLEADFGFLRPGPCKELVAQIGQPFFTIVQSGTDLVISLNNPQKTVLSGVLQGATLTVGSANPPTAQTTSGNCGNPEGINLVATVGKEAEQPALAGTLSINGCASCSPVAFHATRQASSGKGGR